MPGSGFLVLVVLVATTRIGAVPPQAEPDGVVESRTAALEALRRDKLTRLRPERRSTMIDMANEAIEGFVADGGSSSGFQPVIFGGTRSGHGFSYGIGYGRSDIWSGRLAFDLTARATPRKAYRFDLTLEVPRIVPRILGEGWTLRYDTKFENSPQMDYYGPGWNSALANRASYRLEDTEMELSLERRLTRRFTVAGRVGGYFVNTGPGHRGGVPSIEQVFTSDEAPGLNEQSDYLVWGGLARLDYRDRPDEPTSGGHYYVRFTHYSDRVLRRHAFTRLRGFAEQYLPYHNGGRVIALRLETQLAFVGSGSEQQVPFYLQPVLGGNSRLRGFARYRFYDAASILAVVEHRWYVFAGLDAAVFAETGKVAPRNGLLNLNDLRWSGGVSLRFKMLDTFFLRFDNAFSREGHRMILTFSDVFGRENRW